MSALQKATHHLQPCTIFTPQSLPNWRANFPDVVIFQFGITIDKTKCLVSILHNHLLTILLQRSYNFWKINYTKSTLPIWCIFYKIKNFVFYGFFTDAAKFTTFSESGGPYFLRICSFAVTGPATPFSTLRVAGQKVWSMAGPVYAGSLRVPGSLGPCRHSVTCLPDPWVPESLWTLCHPILWSCRSLGP